MAKTVFTVVVVQDPRTVADWYNLRFGFQDVADLGWYVHQRDDRGHELGWMVPGQTHQPEPWKSRPSNQGFGLCFEVGDVEEAWEAWGKKEISVLPLQREVWGQYHFTVRDPSGCLVDVIQMEDGNES